MTLVLLARRAMNTRFELVLHGAREAALRAAGEEALEEIEHLEARLSLFRPTSEIARLNRDAARVPVKVSPPVFRLLERARALWVLSGGAFDPTIGPLMRLWGFRDREPAEPSAAALAEARARVGMDKVELDPDNFTVRFKCPGLELDLGAIGKGYAVDCAVQILREAGVTSGLIHGGTSSVYGLGQMPDGRPWKVAVPPPAEAPHPDNTAPASATADGPALAEFTLRDTSLGVSAVSGRVVQAGGRFRGHVLDPRTGEPVQRAHLAAVVLPEALESDALSTALLVLGRDGLARLEPHRPGWQALVWP